jgi:hypothetical protein
MHENDNLFSSDARIVFVVLLSLLVFCFRIKMGSVQSSDSSSATVDRMEVGRNRRAREIDFVADIGRVEALLAGITFAHGPDAGPSGSSGSSHNNAQPLVGRSAFLQVSTTTESDGIFWSSSSSSSPSSTADNEDDDDVVDDASWSSSFPSSTTDDEEDDILDDLSWASSSPSSTTDDEYDDMSDDASPSSSSPSSTTESEGDDDDEEEEEEEDDDISDDLLHSLFHYFRQVLMSELDQLDEEHKRTEKKALLECVEEYISNHDIYARAA